MSSAATHLTTVIRHWPDLTDALGGRTATTWPPAGRINDHIRNTDEPDAEAERQRALELRLLERDPAQLGQRPIPLRVTILDTMQAVHAELLDCADQTAGAVQRPVMGPLPAGYPEADRARRAVLAMRDQHDPRRWQWTGRRPDARYTALWLLGRIQGAPGPFRPLTAPQADRIASVARHAAQRVEQALDIADRITRIADSCPACEGRIEVRGGDGQLAVARCRSCGRIWTEHGTAVVA